jgi:methylenetetrahydrofolate reductase (NADPH)
MHSPFRRHSVEPAMTPTMPHRAASVVPHPAATRTLAAAMRYELVPIKSVEDAILALPDAAPVSVTCSPAKGLTATLELTARLLDRGHHAVPHLAARQVEGPEHVAWLAHWIRDHQVREVFVVAGDAPYPMGPYGESLPFLRRLLAYDSGIDRVGIPGYPDGHALISGAALRDALHSKEALLAEAGVDGVVTTQMCFEPVQIRRWLIEERTRGLELAVELGIPGVVQRTALMTMGVRLGVGASLRYLRKNRTTMGRMLAPGHYDPSELVDALAGEAPALGITGLHAFTFNGVADTSAWQRSILGLE